MLYDDTDKDAGERVRLSYYWNNWKQDDVNGYDKQAVSNR
jgi:hypothetical protein